MGEIYGCVLWVWLAGGRCSKCEWVESMGVVSRRQVWVESMSVVVRRYIDFLILLIPTPLVSALLASSSIPTSCSLFKKFSFILCTQ